MATSPKWKKIALAAAVVVVLLLGFMQSGLLILFGNYFAIEGDVVSVSANSEGVQEAVVRLNWGPVVRASIPSACVVFPEQIAVVNFTGPVVGSAPSFRLWESREKQ
jgi:hypothetical protein